MMFKIAYNNRGYGMTAGLCVFLAWLYSEAAYWLTDSYEAASYVFWWSLVAMAWHLYRLVRKEKRNAQAVRAVEA